MTAPVLLFDADCAFCTRSAAAMGRFGLTARVEPMQRHDLASLGVDADRAAREIPYVDGHRVRYGAEAIAAALTTGPRPWRLLGRALRAPVVRRLADWVYRLVAAHRHRLPGGRAECRI